MWPLIIGFFICLVCAFVAVLVYILLTSRDDDWVYIELLDKSKTQRVLVTQDGLVALRIWDAEQQRWELDSYACDGLPEGRMLNPHRDRCCQPTHWKALPFPPVKHVAPFQAEAVEYHV